MGIICETKKNSLINANNKPNNENNESFIKDLSSKKNKTNYIIAII